MSASPSEREETEQERLDRDLNQLLNELRVAMPRSAFVIAPTAYHRLMFRERDKPRLITISSHLTLAALFALAIAMIGAVLLVTDVLFDGRAVVATAVLTAIVFVGLWFVLGAVRHVSGERSH